jgi:Spy/CpxP family protein refolding chaperone
MCGERHETGEHHRSLLAGLNLTPAQKAQIKQIRQQYRAAHPCGSPPDRAARAQMRQQILNVLTPAQRAQLQAERNGQHPY